MIIDTGFEDKVAACLLKSNEFCMAAAQHVKPSYFDSPMRHNLVKAGTDYYMKYGTKINSYWMIDSLKTMMATKVITEKDVPLYVAEYKQLLDMDVTDYKKTLESVITFVKNKETRKLIEDAVKKFLPKNDFKAIEDGMRAIADISTTSEIQAYEYMSAKSIEERTEQRAKDALSMRCGISTGIKRIDDHMPRHGWYIKELYTILAPPKRGKSQALQFFANIAMLQGFNVAVFTCEMSKEQYAERMDAMNANIEIKKLPDSYHAVAEKLRTLKNEGRLFIFEYPPMKLTAAEIERQLRKLEIEKGVAIEMVVVDYADIMAASRKYENKLDEQGTVYEDLRGLAVTCCIPVLTASQVNRIGSEKTTIRGKDTSGTWEKVMISDAVISLSGTEAELAKGEMRIVFAECRHMPSKTFKIQTAYNFGRFYKEFIETVVTSEE